MAVRGIAVTRTTSAWLKRRRNIRRRRSGRPGSPPARRITRKSTPSSICVRRSEERHMSETEALTWPATRLSDALEAPARDTFSAKPVEAASVPASLGDACDDNSCVTTPVTDPKAHGKSSPPRMAASSAQREATRERANDPTVNFAHGRHANFFRLTDVRGRPYTSAGAAAWGAVEEAGRAARGECDEADPPPARSSLRRSLADLQPRPTGDQDLQRRTGNHQPVLRRAGESPSCRSIGSSATI